MDVIDWPTGHRLFLLPVIRGLESERLKVRNALQECSPNVIAVSVSPEELDGLAKFEGGEVEASNIEEQIYMERLAAFGEVSKPPPCFLEARDQAKERGLKLEALDLNNEDFTEAYVTNVSTVEMMMQSWIANKLQGPQLLAVTPEEFVLKFDWAVNRKDGFKRLEQAREKHMAKRLGQLMDESKDTLALIELERLEGVRRALAPAYLPL
jgi:hypothetical protein